LLKRNLWPLPLIVLGTLLAIFGSTTFPCNCLGIAICKCTDTPDHELNFVGLLITIVFTYVLVFLSIRVGKAQEVLNYSAPVAG
jgi:hypothetical protein